AATRDVALMVLAGAVNKQMVAALDRVRIPALGLCGGDAALIRASRIERPPARQSAENGEDLGFVGRPQKVNTRVLEIVVRDGMIPKLRSCARTLGHVREIDILPSGVSNSVIHALQNGRSVGTRIVPAERKLGPVRKQRQKAKAR